MQMLRKKSKTVEPIRIPCRWCHSEYAESTITRHEKKCPQNPNFKDKVKESGKDVEIELGGYFVFKFATQKMQWNKTDQGLLALAWLKRNCPGFYRLAVTALQKKQVAVPDLE